MSHNLALKIERKDQLIEDFKEFFDQKIYINQKGCSSFINGKVARLAFSKPALFSQMYLKVSLKVVKLKSAFLLFNKP